MSGPKRSGRDWRFRMYGYHILKILRCATPLVLITPTMYTP